MTSLQSQYHITERRPVQRRNSPLPEDQARGARKSQTGILQQGPAGRTKRSGVPVTPSPPPQKAMEKPTARRRFAKIMLWLLLLGLILSVVLW